MTAQPVLFGDLGEVRIGLIKDSLRTRRRVTPRTVTSLAFHLNEDAIRIRLSYDRHFPVADPRFSPIYKVAYLRDRTPDETEYFFVMVDRDVRADTVQRLAPMLGELFAEIPGDFFTGDFLRFQPTQRRYPWFDTARKTIREFIEGASEPKTPRKMAEQVSIYVICRRLLRDNPQWNAKRINHVLDDFAVTDNTLVTLVDGVVSGMPLSYFLRAAACRGRHDEDFADVLKHHGISVGKNSVLTRYVTLDRSPAIAVCDGVGLKVYNPFTRLFIAGLRKPGLHFTAPDSSGELFTLERFEGEMLQLQRLPRPHERSMIVQEDVL